jgi:hypothetical protein
VKDASLVMKRFALLSLSQFTSTKSTEVLYSSGDSISVQTEDDTSRILSVNVLQVFSVSSRC